MIVSLHTEAKTQTIYIYVERRQQSGKKQLDGIEYVMFIFPQLHLARISSPAKPRWDAKYSNDVKVQVAVCSQGQLIWHMHTSPSQSASIPGGRYVMTSVCAAARHFHTDGPLAWNNPLIKGFLYYQPSSPSQNHHHHLPSPLFFFFFSYIFKGIPPSSRGNYSPSEFIQKSPHTHKHILSGITNSTCTLGLWAMM